MAQETIFAVMIFVVVLLMSQAFVAPVMGARRAARGRLRERITALGGSGDGQAHAALVRQKYLQRLTPFQRRLEALPYMDRVASLLSQAGLEYPAHRVILISLGLSAVAGILAFMRTDSYVLSLLAVLFGASLPLSISRCDVANVCASSKNNYRMPSRSFLAR